uniref:Uncharacterized protein n=1 Tax=Glossina austeni TaxID=7395 RepID=A0A1A9VFU9_GLOAU
MLTDEQSDVEVRQIACPLAIIIWRSGDHVSNFDVKDILNAKLMPVRFFNEELLLLHNSDSILDLKDPDQYLNTQVCNTSDLMSATKTMNYHRRMMNKYLLSTYLVQQIADAINDQLPNVRRVKLLQRRLGSASNISDAQATSDSNYYNATYSNHRRLKDQGSSEYLSWLHKIKTLTDIQKQLPEKRTDKSEAESVSVPSNRRNLLTSNYESEADDEDYDDSEDGDITGYAFISEAFNSSHNPQHYQQHEPNDVRTDLYGRSISKAGYEQGYNDHHVLHRERNSPNSLPFQQYEARTNLGKSNTEIRLKDVADIALTTLAFLSFGMFILQVLMCITMTKDETNLSMMAMEGGDNGDLANDGIEEIRRTRRSPLLESDQKMQILNNLARRALMSIDAAIFIRNNHFSILCENNKLSVQQSNILGLWIPMWRKARIRMDVVEELCQQ